MDVRSRGPGVRKVLMFHPLHNLTKVRRSILKTSLEMTEF